LSNLSLGKIAKIIKLGSSYLSFRSG